jgi:CBS domain-containing protein
MSLSAFKHPIIEVAAEVSIRTAACAMRDNRVGSLVVTRGGRPIGIVTDRDLVVRAVAAGCNVDEVPLSKFVTRDPITVHENDGVVTAIDRMRIHGVRRLPIVDWEGKTVGIVTVDDLLSELGAQMGALCAVIENNADASDSQ